jgi:hypothetical protein
MTRSLIRRVNKLEQAIAVTAEAQAGKGHWIIVEPMEDPAPKIADLHASPEWQDGDHITVWRIVNPPQRTAA